MPQSHRERTYTESEMLRIVDTAVRAATGGVRPELDMAVCDTDRLKRHAQLVMGEHAGVNDGPRWKAMIAHFEYILACLRKGELPDNNEVRTQPKVLRRVVNSKVV